METVRAVDHISAQDSPLTLLLESKRALWRADIM